MVLVFGTGSKHNRWELGMVQRVNIRLRLQTESLVLHKCNIVSANEASKEIATVELNRGLCGAQFEHSAARGLSDTDIKLVAFVVQDVTVVVAATGLFNSRPNHMRLKEVHCGHILHAL